MKRLIKLSLKGAFDSNLGLCGVTFQGQNVKNRLGKSFLMKKLQTQRFFVKLFTRVQKYQK